MKRSFAQMVILLVFILIQATVVIVIAIESVDGEEELWAVSICKMYSVTSFMM